MDADRPSQFSTAESGSAPNYRTYLRSSADRYDGGPGIDPSRILVFLKTRFWQIFLSFATVMGAVTAVTFLLPKAYESSASFLVEQERRSVNNIPVLDALGRLGQLASRETEIALIQSRRVVEPVVDRGDLHVLVHTADGTVEPLEVFTSFDAGRNAVAGTYELRVTYDGRVEVVDTENWVDLASAANGEPLAFANVLAGPLLEQTLTTAVRDSGVHYTIEVEVIPFSEAVHETQKRIEVASVQRNADLVELTCSGKTPEGAQWLCEAVAESYLTLRAEIQTVEAATTAEFLTEQVNLVQGRLNAAEDSLRSFAERRSAVGLEVRAAEEVRQNAQLWAEREQLVAERASLEALTRQIENNEAPGTRKYRDFASFPTFLKNQNQIVTELVSSLVELDNRRNDLAVRRSEEDVELAALEVRIAEIEGQLRSTALGYTEALSAQIRSLDEALDNSRVVLAAIPFQQVQTARLNRQISLLGELYGFLHTRLQEAELAQAVDLPSVRVVDRASLAFKQSSPNVRFNLALGFLLATSFGLLVGLWSEYSDPRIWERRVVEELTGLTVLGVLPGMKKPGPVISMRHVKSNGNDSESSRGRVSMGLMSHLTSASKGRNSVSLVPRWTPERSLALEAFRTLSSDLGHVGRTMAADGLKTVVVTSPSLGEGKTYTAVNLAIARASHGSKTLLIDADLKARGVSKFLNIPKTSKGLTEMLTPGAEIPQHLHTFKVGSGNWLLVMPAGAGTSHSAELLEGDRFRDFLDKMKHRFELVVIDAPPLNVVADAAAVASMVDGVVVVVREGVSDRGALELTLERLRRIGAHTAGIVLNDVDLPSSYRKYSHVK